MLDGSVVTVQLAGYCEHGILDGEWCPACNAEYKRARAGFLAEEGVE